MAEALANLRMDADSTFDLDMAHDPHNESLDTDSDNDDIQVSKRYQVTNHSDNINDFSNRKTPTHSLKSPTHSTKSSGQSKESSPEYSVMANPADQKSPTQSTYLPNSQSNSDMNSLSNDHTFISQPFSSAKSVPKQTVPLNEDKKTPLQDTDVDIHLNGTAVEQIDRYGFVGGKEFTDPEKERRLPIAKLVKREMKWLDMFQNWEKWMSKRFKKVKNRCRKGIPVSVRSKAWQYLCGSNMLMEQNPGKFQEYLSHPGDPKFIEDIKKDLHRQFPRHIMFMSSDAYGQEDLYRILFAYTVHNPTDGYCQAQAPLAAVLLMHMSAEEAFWCFVSICEKYLPGYYSHGLEAIQIDGDVLYGLMKHTNPAVYKHMKKHRVEPILYMTEWFMCVFSRTLPWSCVMRVWDMFFCEGVKVIFRIGLVLVQMCLGSQEKLQACPGMYETLEKLRQIPKDIDEDFIVRETLRLNVTERDMEKEHHKQMNRRKAAKEKASKEKNGKPEPGKSKSRK